MVSLVVISLAVFRHVFLCGDVFPVTAAYQKHRPKRLGRTILSPAFFQLPAHRSDCPDSFPELETLDVVGVARYTKDALQWRGGPRGVHALETLGELCSARIPYVFDAKTDRIEGSMLSNIPALIPRTVATEVLAKVEGMQKKGWLSTNPDSVDGLPSFHLNLVSNGVPVVDMSPGAELNVFQTSLRDLTESVTPYVYNRLLPQVHDLMNCTNILVSDVFLRRYGDAVIEGTSRHGLSAHCDVFSKVTAVVAMDDCSKDGTNGLYTTVVSQGCGLGSSEKTSNHASLRRFFPLCCGDGVLHSWDVLHGVDVEPGLDRTSLIVWFTTTDEVESDGLNAPSWLLSRQDMDTNPVAQFVLASAIESRVSSNVGSTSTRSSMHFLNASLNTADQDSDECMFAQVHSLYLESASRENTFALTRIGVLCEIGQLSPASLDRASTLLATLGDQRIPPPVMAISAEDPDHSSSMVLAKRFWWEGAIRGNPNAQMLLADQIMAETTSESMDEMAAEEASLLATVLFALAAQQSHPEAIESLHRVIQINLAQRHVESEEEFLDLPIVRTAIAALGTLP
jgi:hypothetical protein